MNPLRISILTDNPESWIIPYVEKLKKELQPQHFVKHYFEVNELDYGDILLILSCEKLIKEQYLKLHKSNIVIHPSALPEGKGWSPLAWQILEGKNSIPVTMFEATKNLDAGPTYFLDYIKLNGGELNDEIKHKQGVLTINLIKKYLEKFPNNTKTSQKGKETIYPKRNKENSKLDVDKSVREQFNLLRVVDNERYPAFFELNGERYTIKITKNSSNNLI